MIFFREKDQILDKLCFASYELLKCDLITAELNQI